MSKQAPNDSGQSIRLMLYLSFYVVRILTFLVRNLWVTATRLSKWTDDISKTILGEICPSCCCSHV